MSRHDLHAIVFDSNLIVSTGHWGSIQEITSTVLKKIERQSYAVFVALLGDKMTENGCIKCHPGIIFSILMRFISSLDDKFESFRLE